MPSPTNTGNPSPKEKLPPTVIALGWVSLLTDTASEMIYPFIPAFLRSLGGGAQAIGWIEGASETISAALKLLSGRIAENKGSRKSLIALGYGLSALSRPLYALASLPIHAIFIRMGDRVGKGLRGPPRDSMVADAVHGSHRGRAFGFHRMMDNLGAVFGSLAGFSLAYFMKLPIQSIFIVSIIPGLMAVLIILLFLKSPASHQSPPKSPAPSAPRARLPSISKRYFLACALFALAGAGDLFFLRRLSDLGLGTAFAPIAWMSLQLGKALFNLPGGVLSDRIGHKNNLFLAWLLYGITYIAFGTSTHWLYAWLLFIPYALHYGLAESSQKALLAELVPPEIRGRAFGILLALEGILLLPANIGFGYIYDKIGSPSAFYLAGSIALCASLLLALIVPRAHITKAQSPG